MKFFVALFLLLNGWVINAGAQPVKIAYCRQNIAIDDADRMEMAANISGNHHLLRFTVKENPVVFVFNSHLDLQQKIILPFKTPEKAEIRIIAFAKFYYIFIHPRFTHKYLFWKIDADGNATDMSVPFAQLLQSQSGNFKLNFQLLRNEEELYMVYHTDLDNNDKNTVVMVQADTMLNIVFAHKVSYAFKKDEEQLREEVLIFGRYLLVLKTGRSNTALEVMKVNLATGYTIKNIFYSSGYLYSQSSISYNSEDTTITVTAMLSDRGVVPAKNYVFICRLNKILIEQTPFTILKTQFNKATNTNFLLVDHSSKWVPLKAGYEKPITYGLGNTSLYEDLTMPDSNRMRSTIKPITTTGEQLTFWDPQEPAIRFSLLDKTFAVIDEKYISNRKDSYTIKPTQFTRFTANKKEYMLVGQQFSRRHNGLLMVSSNNEKQLVYTDIRLNTKSTYVLSKSRLTSPNTIVIPYIHKHEAGFVQLTIE